MCLEAIQSQSSENNRMESILSLPMTRSSFEWIAWLKAWRDVMTVAAVITKMILWKWIQRMNEPKCCWIIATIIIDRKQNSWHRQTLADWIGQSAVRNVSFLSNAAPGHPRFSFCHCDWRKPSISRTCFNLLCFFVGVCPMDERKLWMARTASKQGQRGFVLSVCSSKLDTKAVLIARSRYCNKHTTTTTHTRQRRARGRV